MRYSNHSKIRKLSDTAKNAVENLEWSLGLAEIDDIFSSERCDLKSDLNAVLLNRMPRFIERRESLKSLSLTTTLEGQLVENRGVQRIVAKVNLEWIKARPMCMVGKANFKKYVFKPPKRVVKTNKSVELCNKYFENELKIFIKNYCKCEDISDSVDFLVTDPCDIIVKSRINNFKKKLTEHFALSLRGLQNDNNHHKQRLIPLDDSRNHSKLVANELSTTRLPKISDFTSEMIKKTIDKENFSAYNHLNAKYSSRFDDTIRDMNVEEELENIIHEELVSLTRVGDRLDVNRGNIRGMINDVGVYNMGESIDGNLRLSRDNKRSGGLRSSKGELEDILNVEFDSIIDEKVDGLAPSGMPCGLEQQFDAFTKELNMVAENNNSNRNNNVSNNNNRAVKQRKSYQEASERKSESKVIYDYGVDDGKRMRAVYDKTISNDDEEVDYKRNFNVHIVVGDDDRMSRNDDGMGERMPDDMGAREKKRREYEERKLKKRMHYEEYYRAGGEKRDGVEEVKRRRKRGVDDERKKKKKEERKQKKKKRNRHKEKEAKAEKKDLESEKVKPFKPDRKLYYDSSLSFCIDVYQFKSLKGHEVATEVMQQAPTTKLDVNFEPDFDITHAPSLIHDTPLMRMFLDTSGAMNSVAETISHLKEFNIDVVDDRNAFLWSLKLTSLDNSQATKLPISELDVINVGPSSFPANLQISAKKSTNKPSSNPLIQAFKQAVEANKNKQKEEKSNHSANSKPSKSSKYLLMGNMGSGLGTLFRLQSNLKTGTRDMVQEITEGFQKDLQKFLKKQELLESQEVHSSPIRCNFSDSLDHFQSISSLTHKLYSEAEFKLSQRQKLLKYNQQYNKYGTYTLSETATNDSTLSIPTSTTSNYNSTTLQTYYQSPLHSVNESSQPIQPPTIVVTPTNTTTESPSNTNDIIPHHNYDYYQAYHPYSWTYMPPYNIPTYPHNYFQPLYPNYSHPDHLYPPYSFPTAIPSYTPSTNNPVFSDPTPVKQSRFHVFMVDSPETVAAEKHLENSGSKKFDIHNLSLLNYTGSFECQIFIHHTLLPSLHLLQNLLTLKRDPRVMFVEFSSIDDVIERRFQGVFPRGGVVLLHLNVLLSCNADVLDSLCKHIASTTDTEAPWTIITSAHAVHALHTISNSTEENNPEEHVRMTEVTHILSTHQSDGLIRLMNNQSEKPIESILSEKPIASDQSELHADQASEKSELISDLSTDQSTPETIQPSHEQIPDTLESTDQSNKQPCDLPFIESTNDYFNHLLNFQSTNHHTYRHFIFITDLPRTHPDTQSFLSCGMEVFNLVDFMQAFVSKSVEHTTHHFEGFETRVTSQQYIDAPLSLCSQTISF